MRILKTKKLFSKGAKTYYSKTLYKITGRNGLKFIIEGNNKIKNVLPFQLKKVDKDKKVLDDTGVITESVSGPISGLSSLATGIKAGAVVARLLKKRASKKGKHE